MLRALLIDDEVLAREEMHRLLAAHSHVVIVGEADDVPTARTLLEYGGYDVAFLDIDLPGGNGFDLVPHVIGTARIVFVTAHNDYALRAFEVNALDYLLKPVSAARLAASLERIGRATAAAPVSDDATEATERSLGSLAADDRVFLKNERGARFVPLSSFAAVISCDNYSEVYINDGSHFLVRRSLKAWETSLPADLFLRVHRQALVNLSQIELIDDRNVDAPILRLRGVKQAVGCSHRLTPELRRRIEK